MPRQQWASTTTPQAMLPLEKFKRISPTAELGSALPQMVKESINCP